MIIVSHAPASISEMDYRSVRVGVCDASFQQGFHWRIDQSEAILLVCLSAEKEVTRKSCQRRGWFDDGHGF